MDTKTFIHQLCYKEKSNVPEADTKTPKKRKMEKIGERVPSQPRQWCALGVLGLFLLKTLFYNVKERYHIQPKGGIKHFF